MSLDNPLYLRNILGGMNFLLRWHSPKNANHPLRLAEQADTRQWLAARQPAPQPVTAPRTRRVKPIPKRPDPDGVYRL